MASTSIKKKRRGLSLTKKRALAGWLFVLPFVIGILFIYGPILLDSLMYSFSTTQTINGRVVLTFAGFDNYVSIFNPSNPDKSFPVTLLDSTQDLILQIPAIVIFALFMAIILNQKMAGRTVFRAIFFLPVILCTGIIDSIDAQSAMLEAAGNVSGVIDTGAGEDTGIMSVMDLQNLLGNIKVGAGLVEYVVGLVNDIFDIVSRSGVQMLIFLSGLQSISPSIYESCQIEGASAWETFWKITLPMISPMILVNFIYTVIDAFTSADNRMMSFIGGNTSYFTRSEMAAMYWIYMLVVLAMIALVAVLMKAFVFYQRRD
ncbi:MAG: sugar ABC transporter permease [Clostridia bacterium]|nr:sugar ABC transporter permease [Clostridia bacterium]